MRSKTSPRTYNQVQVPRPYVQGKRRVSIYWTWSYPWESQRDMTEMDNRFSTITEVRRVAWPNYETPEYSAHMFLQGPGNLRELRQERRAADIVECSQRGGGLRHGG